MTVFIIFITLLVTQRIVELWFAKRNEKGLKQKGALEIDEAGYRIIVIFHFLFFVSFIIEYLVFDRFLSRFWMLPTILFALAQIVRYWAIYSLGRYWNTKVIVLPGSGLVRKGPYKYLKHPNYMVVIAELFIIPMIFSCYLTSIVFGAVNIFIIKRRINIEERALKHSAV